MRAGSEPVLVPPAAAGRGKGIVVLRRRLGRARRRDHSRGHGQRGGRLGYANRRRDGRDVFGANGSGDARRRLAGVPCGRGLGPAVRIRPAALVLLATLQAGHRTLPPVGADA
ncbi:hypothetical protein [Dactylosporangium sp. CA-092794]|uniref:hypothetical protein n=1 Tax=Dactylosporangium sp. CA-092794 TaxID=3239929 RepID=UPI003D91E357